MKGPYIEIVITCKDCDYLKMTQSTRNNITYMIQTCSKLNSLLNQTIQSFVIPDPPTTPPNCPYRPHNVKE